MEWTYIKNQLPPRTDWYLVTSVNADDAAIRLALYTEQGLTHDLAKWEWPGKSRNCKVIAWQETPEPAAWH